MITTSNALLETMQKKRKDKLFIANTCKFNILDSRGHIISWNSIYRSQHCSWINAQMKEKW